MQFKCTRKQAAAVLTAFALTTGAAFSSTVEAAVNYSTDLTVREGMVGQGGNWNGQKDVTVGGRFIVNGENVMGKIDNAQPAADAAMGEANRAQGTADAAMGVANSAQDTADRAMGAANRAQDTADRAMGAANRAQDTADRAMGAANRAQNTADRAMGAANRAQDTADRAMGAANRAQGTANEALQKANENAEAIHGLEVDMDQTKEQISGLREDMNQTQEVIRDVDNRVTGLEVDMEQTQNHIKDLDTRMDTAEADIDTINTQIGADEFGSLNLTNGGSTLVEGINKNTQLIGGTGEGGALELDNGATTVQEGINANTTMIQENSNRISGVERRVSDLSKDIDSVGAMATALAGLHPLDYDGTGSKFQLAAAVGTYDGAQALALGGFYHFNEDVMMSLGGAMTMDGNKERAWNVGFTVRLGQSGKREVPVSTGDILFERISEQDAQIAEQNAQIAELMAKVEALMEQEEK